MSPPFMTSWAQHLNLWCAHKVHMDGAQHPTGVSIAIDTLNRIESNNQLAL
jgi:hypothetical protein